MVPKIINALLIELGGWIGGESPLVILDLVNNMLRNLVKQTIKMSQCPHDTILMLLSQLLDVTVPGWLAGILITLVNVQ